LVDAIKTNNVKLATRIIEKSEDDIYVDFIVNNIPIVSYAIKKHMPRIALKLLILGANPNKIDLYSDELQTPLMYASIYGDGIVVKWLLANNVKIDEVNANYQTALMLAAENNNWYIVQLLLSAGANANINTPHSKTALLLALKGSESYYTILKQASKG
jgi:hypothetical protein